MSTRPCRRASIPTSSHHRRILVFEPRFENRMACAGATGTMTSPRRSVSPSCSRWVAEDHQRAFCSLAIEPMYPSLEHIMAAATGLRPPSRGEGEGGFARSRCPDPRSRRNYVVTITSCIWASPVLSRQVETLAWEKPKFVPRFSSFERFHTIPPQPREGEERQTARS